MADTSESPDTQPQEGSNSTTIQISSKNWGSSDLWFGAFVWVAIIAGTVYFSLFSGQVDVLLNVSGIDPLVAEGVVTNEGAPVSSGTIQILVEEPQGDRLLASAVSAVSATGTFRIDLTRAKFSASPNASDGLRVKGNYRGRVTGTGTDNENTTLKGSSTVYMNMTPPWGMNWGFGALGVVMALLVVLFTGPLRPRKARLLFGVTYVVTFSACVIPIILTVAASRSPALVATMRRAPVGIINAKAKGLEEAQWLVNIGGSVNQVSTEESGAGGRLLPTGPPTAVVSVQPAQGSSGTTSTDVGNSTPDAGTTGGGSAAPATAGEVPQSVTVPVRVEPLGFEVKGGLAIPLYVIVLAMLGAGINMTRRVPQIQTDYDLYDAETTLKSALSAPMQVLGMGQDGDNHPNPALKDPSVIRRDLIETYMYFLSAPFLAVAVYYLLQIVASSVAEPVLVVIAFASGLMSETVVSAIMVFADNTLSQLRRSKDTGEALAETVTVK